MYLTDGTLLVCFLGDRAGGARSVPRVAVWRERGPLEEVELPDSAARMIARLALPVEPYFTGAGANGSADRIASALGGPLPQRSAADLRAALGVGKTQEWRIRRELRTALYKQGLSAHLDEGWGRIGLREATSDAAAVALAVRHEQRERAVQVLEAVGGEAPERVGWLLTEGWQPAVRDAVAAALAEVKQWHAVPRSLPAGPAGSAPKSTGLEVEPRHSQALALPWAALPPSRYRPRRRHRWLTAGAALVAAAALLTAFVLPGDPSTAQAPFPGSWPGKSNQTTALIANLTTGAPLGFEVAAKTDDVVLVRMRLPGKNGSRTRTGPIGVSANLESVSTEAIRYYTSTTGFHPEAKQGGFSIRTGSGEQRLSVMPSTTQLIDSGGRIVKELNDLDFGQWDWVGRLPGQTPYFVDTQLRVVPATPSLPGQVSDDSNLHCDPTESTAETLEVPRGTVVTCTAHLVNLGPSVLPSVRVTIGCTYWKSALGPSFALQLTTRSTAGEPETNYFTQTVEASRGRAFGVAYVPHSAELFNASLEDTSGDLDLREGPNGGIILGPLEPGAGNSLFLRFKARVY